jgi:hypothetical protein
MSKTAVRAEAKDKVVEGDEGWSWWNWSGAALRARDPSLARSGDKRRAFVPEFALSALLSFLFDLDSKSDGRVETLGSKLGCLWLGRPDARQRAGRL